MTTPENRDKQILDKLLIVEDSKMFNKAVSTAIERDLGLKTSCGYTYKDAKEILSANSQGFMGAVLDLVLPDAQKGEVVDLVLQHDLPVIVMTGTFNDEIRDRCIDKKIVDYIVKDSPSCIDSLLKIIKRLHSNQTTKILVVDDSKTVRTTLTQILEGHRFITLTANDGVEALAQLREHEDIKLVIADYAMPIMDGFELLVNIRKDYSSDNLAVIGISTQGGSVMSAKFLKLGANDFITKPFGDEEFFLRINQNLEMLDHIASIRSAAIRDFLTGLYNRRYFFEVGETLFDNAVRHNRAMVVAMLDIDFFKKVNDTHGHSVGDQMIKHVAEIISSIFRSSDILARMGGEEFCLLLQDMKPQYCFAKLDELRQLIAEIPLYIDDQLITVTVSIGATTQLGRTLEATVDEADKQLYKAKENGRNQVQIIM